MERNCGPMDKNRIQGGHNFGKLLWSTVTDVNPSVADRIAVKSRLWVMKPSGLALIRENMVTAWKRVKANKGSAGTDRLSISDTQDHLKTHWQKLKEALLDSCYRPMPVRRWCAQTLLTLIA